MKVQSDDLFQHAPRLSSAAKNNVLIRIKSNDPQKKTYIRPVAAATIFIVASCIFLFSVINPTNSIDEFKNGNGQPQNETGSLIVNDEQDDLKEKEAQIRKQIKKEQEQIKKAQEQMENKKNEAKESINLRTKLLKESEIIYRALEQLDYETIASKAHPELGVTFPAFADYGNPVGGVNGGPYVSLSREELLKNNNQIFQFGADNGDHIIEMSLNEYIQNVLINHFNQSLPIREISFNEQLFPKGGVINTIHQYYPEAKYVEYFRYESVEYFKYESDDPNSTQSLRFVYQNFEGEWYLTAIVRDVYSP